VGVGGVVGAGSTDALAPGSPAVAPSSVGTGSPVGAGVRAGFAVGTAATVAAEVGEASPPPGWHVTAGARSAAR